MFDKVNYVVDADIKGFFDNLDHNWLIKFLEHDIADKNFIRYIKRFLIGGVMEDGKKLESDKGTPQGGLISPVLANTYLHYVLDTWFIWLKKNILIIKKQLGFIDLLDVLELIEVFMMRMLRVKL